jgi:hypothetical protein
MPDLDLIKQAEQGARDRRGRFSNQSGNPAGPLCSALSWLSMMKTVAPLPRS